MVTMGHDFSSVMDAVVQPLGIPDRHKLSPNLMLRPSVEDIKMDYVVCFPDSADGRVLLITKSKPHWQAGRLNLVGGKIESGETIIDAAARELLEETGFEGAEYEVLGKIHGSWGTVHCVVCLLHAGRLASQPDEPVDWYDWHTVKDDDRLIPNLRVIIPLMMANVKSWNILQEIGNSFEFQIRTH